MKSKEENNIKDIYDKKTKNYNELTSNILKNYSNKVLELNNFLQISDVLSDMIDEINNAFGMNIVTDYSAQTKGCQLPWMSFLW